MGHSRIDEVWEFVLQEWDSFQITLTSGDDADRGYRDRWLQNRAARRGGACD
jgi:hypothetical protein